MKDTLLYDTPRLLFLLNDVAGDKQILEPSFQATTGKSCNW